MNRLSKVLLLISLCLTLAIPFASKSPDGLETIIKSQRAEPAPIWSGLTNDIVGSVIENSYIASVINGLIGVTAILAVSCLFGWVSFRRKRA